MTLGGVHDLEHGLARVLEQTLGRLGNAAALQGRTANAIDGHEKLLDSGELAKPGRIAPCGAIVNEALIFGRFFRLTVGIKRYFALARGWAES
jgi:hypothetical protein